MKNSGLFFLCLYFAFYIGAPSIFAQTNIGYVLEIRGSWKLNGKTDLRQTQKLPASGVVSIKSPSRYDYIKIADLNGVVQINKQCAAECSFTLPAAPAKTSYLGTIFSSIMNLVWSESPNRYSAHRSRSGEYGDGIVKLEKGKIDVSELLKPDEKTFVQWREIPAKGEDFGDWSELVELKPTDDAVIISDKNLQTGLYEFNFLKRVKNSYEPTASVWILIVSPENYEKSVKTFEQVKELNNKLGDDIKPLTAQMFVRAYLDNMTRQKMK